MYKRHKDLERELVRLVAASPSPPASAPADAPLPSATLGVDATVGDIDPSVLLLSPTTSAGNGLTKPLPQGGETGSGDDDEGSRQGGGDGKSGSGSPDERRRSSGGTDEVPHGEGSTVVLLSPLPSLSPDRSFVREGSVGVTTARSDGSNPTEGGGGGQSGEEEEKGSSHREAAARRGEAAEEDRDETVEAGSDVGGVDLKSQTSKELDEDDLLRVLPSHSSEGERDSSSSFKPIEIAPSGVDAGSRSSESLKPAPSNEVADPVDDERKLSRSSSRHSFLAINNNDSRIGNSPLPLSGDEGEKTDRDLNGDKDGDSDSNGNTMTAQEARVRRMRARFLDMKSLLDSDESSRPPSPKAAGEKSPRKELGYGLAAAVADDDDGASSSPVKGILVALGHEHP